MIDEYKYMDIRIIRDNPDYVRDNQRRRFKDPSIIDKILGLDDGWRNMKSKADGLRQLRNRLSQNFVKAPESTTVFWDDIYTIDKLIDDLLHQRLKIDVLIKDQLKNIVRYINDQIGEIEAETGKTLEERDNLIAELGNKLNSKCIVNDDEENNGLIYDVEFKHDKLPEKPLDHIDLLEKLGFVDIENGIKVAANRGYFLTGFGVRLNQAIINYGLDFLEKRGYKLMETPHFVTGELMSKIVQLSDFKEMMYKIDGEDKYLIATSEQPLTALFNGKVLHDQQLPIKLAGLSSCYRKETGSCGRHVNGIYRVHQFQKVEQFCVTEPEKSWEMFDEMIGVSKEFYESLKLSFRIVNIVSGALNNAAAMKYDLEAWFPGSKTWCELVSCSNVLDYFSKRLGLKGAKQEHLHMLNSTLCANTRTICALVETYQTNDGFIVPDVLRPYLGNKDFIPFVK